MTNSAAEDADRADKADDTLGGPALGAVPLVGGPALRDVAVDLAFKPAGSARALLDDFLSEPSSAVALRLWFGDSKTLCAPIRRDRILRALDRDIAWLDALLSDQVNAILHHPRLQRLEASWRGVRYLVTEAESSEEIKIKVLNVTWADICKDIDRAIEFDQSQLFSKIYSEEFGMPGGEPFGVMIGDYEVQHRRTRDHPSDDLAALKGISGVAAGAFCPFIVGCAPAFLGLDSFMDLGIPIDLRAIFRQPEYARWRSFQDTDDCRFVGITLPRVLMRLPHRDDGSRVDGFRFRESVEHPGCSGYLWGNAAYAFAALLMRSFTQSAWFADIRGTPQDLLAGGIVDSLPVEWFTTDKQGIAIRYSTDVSISEFQERDLAELGLVPLCKVKNTDYSAFYTNQSAQAPKTYSTLAASVNARLSAMLQYIMCVSRFAHFIKVIGRDRIGSFATPEDCERFLQQWLRNYCTGNESPSPELRARYPLREGRVKVHELPGKPGVFACTVHLQPHFQFDDIVSAFKLVTELAPSRAA
jgi:type VI secretion system protein ImpD